jgi:hypothetical protein
MEKNTQLNNNEKDSLFPKITPNSIPNNEKNEKIRFSTNEYKDIKEIIDRQNDSSNKQFVLLVRKRLREPDKSESKNEKVFEKFNKLSINPTVNDKQEKSTEKIFILKENNEQSKKEIDSKEQILENINKRRSNKIFSNKRG